MPPPPPIVVGLAGSDSQTTFSSSSSSITVSGLNTTPALTPHPKPKPAFSKHSSYHYQPNTRNTERTTFNLWLHDERFSKEEV
ncbi:hypothetical protein HK102_013976, partial [Quaeritorhiza haematococci]